MKCSLQISAFLLPAGGWIICGASGDEGRFLDTGVISGPLSYAGAYPDTRIAVQETNVTRSASGVCALELSY